MLPITSTAESYYELVDSLPRTTNWTELKDVLEMQLKGFYSGSENMTIPERKLLAGLRIRERLLSIPWYAKAEERGPDWWIAIKGSEDASMA